MQGLHGADAIVMLRRSKAADGLLPSAITNGLPA
jgi:hypothetical protein